MNLLNYADIERMMKIKKIYNIIRKYFKKNKDIEKIVITQKLINLIPELNKLYHIDFKLNLFDYMDANGKMQSVRFKKISYI